MKKVSILCENLRSIHNVGAIFRTSDCVGNIEKIYLCGYTPTPEDLRMSKVSLGAEKTIPWKKYKYANNVIKKLKEKGYQIIALEKINEIKTNEELLSNNKTTLVKINKRNKENNKFLNIQKNIFEFKPKFPCLFIVGNEVEGISKKVLENVDNIIYIPTNGIKESLNVSVAFGVGIYTLLNEQKI